MTDHLVTFDVASEPVRVPTGTLLSEAARLAGVEIGQPCGGQGRCGRCAVQITSGGVRRRSTVRLSPEDVENGWALACQTVVEGDATVLVPPQEKIERRLTTDRTVADVTVPEGYSPSYVQTLRRVRLELNPPSMDDQTDDWSRLQLALRQQAGLSQCGWLALDAAKGRHHPTRGKLAGYCNPGCAGGYRAWPGCSSLLPGRVEDDIPIWGMAVDIGTTTVTVWLVDVTTGEVKAQASEYNGQIARGEDVVSRIIYASKGDGLAELRTLVLGTINELTKTVCKRVKIQPAEVFKATIAGNSTMMHLLLGIPAASIRLSPFVTAINQPPLLTGE